MNHDDNKPSNQALIDTELEARVVAWVSGEASAFEAAELERLTAGKPELMIFKRRIEAVRGLVAEAIRPDKEPLLMSPDRRAKLLQAIGATETKASPSHASAPVVALTPAKKARRTDRRWLYAVAACLTVGLFTALTIPGFRKTFEMEAKQQAYTRSEQDKSPEPEVSMSLPMAVTPERADIAARRELNSTEFAFKGAIDERAKKQEPELKARESYPFAQRAAGLTSRQGLPVPTGAAPPPRDVAQANAEERYVAHNTLAGTRVRTDLKDTAAAVSVVTDQFLQDTGAGNSQQVQTYVPKAEIGGLRGNFAAPASAPASQGDATTVSAPVTALLGVNEPGAAGGKLAEGQGAQASAGGASATESDEKTIVLSPFSVTATANSGYASKSAKVAAQAGSLSTDKEKTGDDHVDADLPVTPPVKTEPAAQELPEVNASKDPVSTFSLHVSDVSFRLAQAALAKNEPLDEESIRPEEFYNAFDYGDPTPAMAEKVSCRIEQAAHPFLQQRNLVRIAIKVPATGRDAAQPLRLTVLLDTSGSMEREDRAAIAHKAMGALISLLGPNDRLTLIGFSRQPRLLAESLTGDKAGQILEIIANTPAEGGTNLEEALKLGSQLAHRQFESAAQNRIVLLTDGAANLGDANPAQLAGAIEALRQEGIAFDACGVGLDGLDDAMLERLTRKGAGRYYVLNSPEEADAGFARQLAGAFHPAAENVKLQVRFNPARVGHYRLIGFEQHRLREEDFRNDSVAAAALAAEEAAVAVYQVEALPQGEGELGEVYVRFRDTAANAMVERSWTLSYDPHAPAFDQATPTLQLAGTAALLAEKMRGGEAGEAVKLSELAPVVNKLHSHFASEPRVQELVTMFGQLRHLEGE